MRNLLIRRSSIALPYLTRHLHGLLAQNESFGIKMQRRYYTETSDTLSKVQIEQHFDVWVFEHVHVIYHVKLITIDESKIKY